MKGIRMKKTGKWLLTIISKAFVVILVILLLPFAKQLFQLILPDITGEINAQSRILEQKLESSQRLEVTTVEEEGVLEAKTNVIIFGTVGTTTIRYRYTASLGIDLNKVVLTPDSDRIVFLLPEPLILNDGIEALKIDRKNFFSHAIDKSTETLMKIRRRLNRLLKEEQMPEEKAAVLQRKIDAINAILYDKQMAGAEETK